MPKRLSAYEQEAIILFNRAEDTATIFTHEKTWQKQLEAKLGLKPIIDNGFGGKEYKLPETRIKPPRAPRRLSESAKQRLAERLPKNPAHLSRNIVPVVK